MGMLQPSPAEVCMVGSSGNAQPVHCEAVLWRAELCQGEALVLLPCCQGVSSWGISSVTSMLLFPSSNASSLEEEFWIKLLSSCCKEWKKGGKRAALLAVKQPGPCQVALLGWWQCGAQHWLIPTGNDKPFTAPRLVTSPSPRAGLSPGRAAGWQHRAPASQTSWGIFSSFPNVML